MIIIQTTVDDDKKAKELIKLLVETNKIACGTFHEIQSSYKWKEKLVEEQEFEISIYTKASLMREVVDNITERHPYELPKITVLEPVYTLPEYDEWVSKETF
jgi:periplasmic divalent cation tolerance protein